MAEPATAPAPPAAPPAPGGSKPLPAPTGVIRLSEMAVPPTPAAPPPKGSALEKAHEALRKKATGTPEPPAAPPPAKAPAAAPPGATPAGEAPPTGEQPPAEPAAAAAAVPPKSQKVNPYKEWKAEQQAHAKTLKEFADYRAKLPQVAEVEGLSKRAEQAEKLVTALSDEIRYHAYEKSPEFKKEFQDPYEAAFRRALTDLKEVPITDPATGQARQMTEAELSDTLAQISFMSLAQAKEAANRLFPDFAQDMLEARKEIRGLWDKRQAALAEWRDKGSERDRVRMAQGQRQQSELAASIKTAWDKANEELLAHEKRGQYFKPRDGDAEWNNRLEAGYKMTNAAFATNLLDGNLTAEQTAEAVRRYAAVRARSAGWGPLRHQNEQLRARVAELEAELKGYKETTPPAGGSEPGGGPPPGAVSVKEQIKADLRKRAR